MRERDRDREEEIERKGQKGGGVGEREGRERILSHGEVGGRKM